MKIVKKSVRKNRKIEEKTCFYQSLLKKHSKNCRIKKIPINYKYFNIRKRNKTRQEKSLINGIIILKYQRFRDNKVIIAIHMQHQKTGSLIYGKGKYIRMD